MRATQERGWKMRKVTVKKTELLEKVTVNYKQHVKDYEEAFEGYKTEADQLMKNKFKAISEAFSQLSDKVKNSKVATDKPVPLYVPANLLQFAELRPPVSHAKDYEQIIQMLQMSTDETITLESDEFACYVMDDWEWKQDFLNVTSQYKK